MHCVDMLTGLLDTHTHTDRHTDTHTNTRTHTHTLACTHTGMHMLMAMYKILCTNTQQNNRQINVYAYVVIWACVALHENCTIHTLGTWKVFLWHFGLLIAYTGYTVLKASG